MSRTREEILRDIISDESKVPHYHLPSPLDFDDGRRVENAFEWVNFRRPEILDFYRREVYGYPPPRPDRSWSEIIAVKNNALDNNAIRREIRLHFAMDNGESRFMDMILYIPKNIRYPVPVFLGLCFNGIHTITDEDDVHITELERPGQNKTDENRGCQAYRWQFREAIRRGYASAAVCYHDIFPDRADGWEKSIYGMFYPGIECEKIHCRHSSIGAWAWGLSLALDYLETVPEIDGSRTAVHGHSRLGKTALWAAANDTRFRLVISNDSGCGGAALFKRVFGENVEAIINYMPQWFVAGFEKYSGREAEMPFDQHWLISLLAPRPVCIASASEDWWADPKGEFSAGVHASEVYRLFGVDGLAGENLPPAGQKINGAVSYHLRAGKHDQMPEDWQHYFELADIFLKNRSMLQV